MQQHQQPEGPFKVESAIHLPQQSLADARCLAARQQVNGERRSLRIYDKHGQVVSLKRY